MESTRGLTETVAAIRELRGLGAVRVRVGDIEATFAGPASDIETAPKLSPEDAKAAAEREYEATLYHST